MDEIRFNQPQREPASSGEAAASGGKKWGGFGFLKNILKVVAVLVIIAVVVIIGYYAKNMISKSADSGAGNASLYSAVFLSNGQVYFGQLVSKSGLEIVLTDVYYLQVSGDGTQAQTQLSEPKFSLIRLGNELHGPTNELFINRSQVLFYEKLRDDSKVVESIKNYK